MDASLEEVNLKRAGARYIFQQRGYLVKTRDVNNGSLAVSFSDQHISVIYGLFEKHTKVVIGIKLFVFNKITYIQQYSNILSLIRFNPTPHIRCTDPLTLNTSQ